jgi:hypothetical protein
MGRFGKRLRAESMHYRDLDEVMMMAFNCLKEERDEDEVMTLEHDRIMTDILIMFGLPEKLC